MTWFAVDDQMHDHEKFLDIPPDAASLWLHAGSWSAGHRTDGFIPASLIRRWRGCTKRSAAELVARGLWEEATGSDGKPGWRFHQWGQWQPLKAEYETPTDQLRWKRRKALQRNRLLCEEIVTRDRNRCRYCSVRVDFSNKRGATGGTYDHVDPDGENSLENVVVACRRCNGRKKDRTPEEAGMPLLAVPDPRPNTDLAGSGSESVSGQENLALARETGPGQVGAKSVLAGSPPDLAVNGSGSGPLNGNGSQ